MTDDAVTPEQFRAAYDRLRSDASPLPEAISNALVWLLSAVVGEDVDALFWKPGAFETLQCAVVRAVLDLPVPAPAVDREDVVTEHAIGMTDGSMQVRSPHPEIERVFPLAQWIPAHQRHGGRVWRRRVVVVEDWVEVD